MFEVVSIAIPSRRTDAWMSYARKVVFANHLGGHSVLHVGPLQHGCLMGVKQHTIGIEPCANAQSEYGKRVKPKASNQQDSWPLLFVASHANPHRRFHTKRRRTRVRAHEQFKSA